MRIVSGILLIIFGLIIIKFCDKNVEENFWDRFRQKIYTEKYYKTGAKFEKWAIGVLIIYMGIRLLIS